MNYSMIARLILKDWYLQRWTILASVVAGAGTLMLILAGGKIGFLLGIIALVTVLIAVGAQLATATIVEERKNQTLAFVMSLPISYREYTASKIVGNLLIFLVPWLALVLGSFALILVRPEIPRGLLPFAAIMSVEILLSTCLVAATALITESQGWTIGAVITGNLALNGIGYYVAHVDSIANGMSSKRIGWTSAASGLLGAEMILVLLLLSMTFFYQSRKKDFV
jgi:ABC-2 type transport system permease protein